VSITQELHKLGFPKDKIAVPSKYVYEAEDGTPILTVWRENMDRDVAIAHINKSVAAKVVPETSVRVVIISHGESDPDAPHIQSAEADGSEWKVASVLGPTNDYSRHRAIIVRDEGFSAK
jgi:hypothetical protein